MTVLTVQYEVRPECVDDLVTAIGEVADALTATRPAGVRYTLGRLPDGVTFFGVLELADGVDNPLPGLPAARELQQRLAAWVVGGAPPVARPLDVVGAYGRDG
jgi:hypothetical protein